MKKNLFFLAAVALTFAACSNDETIESAAFGESNAINFRALTSNVTRASDVNATTLQSNGFTVFANVYNTSTNYFPETSFTWKSETSTYNSENKYYWPSDGALDFFAYANSKPESHASQVSHEALTKVFTVTPDADAQYQTDLVVAFTTNKSKTGTYDPSDVYNPDAASKTNKYGANGVPLNFRHTGCKVAIKLYNGNKDNLDISVLDASICNVKNSGVFTFADATTDVNNSDGTGTILTGSSWADVVSPATTTTSYTQTDASTSKYNVAVGSAAQVGQDWILIPQSFTYATAYSGSNVDDAFNGPCIKVNLKIQNHANNAYIVGAASGTNDGYVTAMWPLKADPTAWAIGKKYTYTVDLAGGGYFPANTSAGTGDALDPILDGAEIKFVTVTVDDWNPEDGNVYTTGL